MNKIYLATNNSGKVQDLQQRLSNVLNVEISSLEDLPQFSDIEETGNTYEENALLKAHLISKHTNCITIADDSGLEVSALGERPGVYSHRYSDDWVSLPGETVDQRNIRKMLFELQNIKTVLLNIFVVWLPFGRTATNLLSKANGMELYLQK